MVTGAKVICVDDHFSTEVHMLYTNLPKKDSIYTIRDVILAKNMNNDEGEVAVLLKELTNPTIEKISIHELAFNAERFRELEDPKEQEKELVEELVSTL